MQRVNDLTPWYVKAAYQLGVPAVIAGLLIWALVTRIDGTLSSVSENLSLHAQDTAYSVKRLEKMELILQRICTNTATTIQDRNACFQ